jgi:hypothetical protein
LTRLHPRRVHTAPSVPSRRWDVWEKHRQHPTWLTRLLLRQIIGAFSRRAGVIFFLQAGLEMTSPANDERDRQLVVVRFQRNMALVCLGAVPLLVWIFTRF